MSRLIPLLSVACVIGIGATAYSRLRAAPVTAPAPTTTSTPPAPAPAATGIAAELHAARRTCTVAAFAAIVQRLQAAVAAQPDDRESWHLLAQAMLERVQNAANLRGIAVGSPVYDDLPKPVADDLAAGLAAVARARELGDDSGDLYRIEAGLLGNQITGLASALQWNGKIQQALKAAGERGQDDPRLHVALGLQRLLAPRLLGNDPQAALEHFEFAAKALTDDERPTVFAAMASYLQQKRLQAIAWLEQAVARNPNNVFARVVLERVRRDEDDPFGRDVTAAEAGSAAAAGERK